MIIMLGNKEYEIEHPHGLFESRMSGALFD
jgi:hypothetical protein